MTQARLMTRPEDYTKLGIKPGVVEAWEDARRDTAEPGHNEVWYFDATMEDGTKTVVAFRPVGLTAGAAAGVDSPNLNVNITTPDGRDVVTMIQVPVEESSISSEKPDVHFGPHYVTGDLTDYDVHVEPVDGIGADLHYHALVEPYRPGGTSVIAMGENEEFYYTDQSIPRCEVTGTVTADGKTWQVTGEGYHDHQWMNVTPFVAWHHWLWGRFYTDSYTVVIYDFIASEKFGFTRIPIFGILDKSGKVIFDNKGDVEAQVTTYHDDQTDKDYPKTSHYVFGDGDKTAEFDIEWSQVLEVRDMYGATNDQYGLAGAKQRAAYDAMGIRPSYMRYYANGTLRLTQDGKTVTESGDMIYEFNYMGIPDPRAHL